MTWLAMIVAGCLGMFQPATISGTVRDSTGAVIAGASVVARVPDARDRSTRTDTQGHFTLTVPAGEITLIVSALQFQSVTRHFGSAGGTPLEIALIPAIHASVTVTAGRIEQPLRDVAAAVSIIDRSRLDRSPAMTTDDVLRQVPAFSLFRRSSSTAAHPTAQGVSLRGIGPSGVSRTLVMLDGVPFNDPFGGWISWTRVPRASLDRIEIVEGSGANLFGNYALGGAINLVTREPLEPWLESTVQYGERRTPALDAAAAIGSGSWSGIVEAGGLRSDGYPVVVPEERGLVDENVSAASTRVYGTIGYGFARGGAVRLHGDLFDESRLNGKRSTIDHTPEQNDTNWRSIGGSLRTPVSRAGELRVAIFGDRVRFRSNFLAVPAATPARSIGRMTLNQFVPSSGLGTAVQWTRVAGRRSVLTAGGEWRRVEGESREDALDPQTGTRVVLHRASGGAQQNTGFFVQDVITPVSPLVITLAVRHDRWTNDHGHNLETDETGAPSSGNRPVLADQQDRLTTPRVAALYRAGAATSIWTSVGWGFRAPTLNELYRQFRVGGVTTLANEALDAERLRSVEAGVRFTPRSSLLLRAAWFDNALTDAVSNVTLTTTGNNVVQQRQNLGLTRVRGLQADAEWRPSAGAGGSVAYIYNDSIVREFEENPALIGKQLPQVARHRATVQIFVAHRRAGQLAVDVLIVGRQFDDDLNVRAVPGHSQAGLPPFATVNLLGSRSVGRGITLFAGVQNLFDQRSYAGTLPTTLGAPRSVSAGVKWVPSMRR